MPVRVKEGADAELRVMHPWIGKSWRARSWNKVVVKDPCPWCGRPSSTLDHVVPQFDPERVEKRRDTEYTVGACSRCNNDKGSRTVLEFLVLRAAAFMWKRREPWVVRVGRQWRNDARVLRVPQDPAPVARVCRH